MFFFFFLGIFGTKVFINFTFFEWFWWILWRKDWWCCYFCSQKWQFKVSINISKSRHQIFLLFIRFCNWNPNKKGRENVSDASGQKWKKSLGEGCDRLIKCSNPNTPLPQIFFSFLSGRVWDNLSSFFIGVPTAKSIKKQKDLMAAFWDIAWF